MNSIDDLLMRLRSERPAMPGADRLTESVLARLPEQKPCPRSRRRFAVRWLRILSSVAAVSLVLLYLAAEGLAARQTPPVPIRRIEVAEIRFASKEDACTYYTGKLNRVSFREQLKTMYYESK